MPKPTHGDYEQCTWAAGIMRAARKIEMAPDVYAALSDTVHAYESGEPVSRLTLGRARTAVRAFTKKSAEIQAAIKAAKG